MPNASWPGSFQSDLNDSLRQLKQLKAMQPGHVYEFSVGIQKVVGQKEAFLRRRAAQEVLKSGYCSGCGDYALVLDWQMNRYGYRSLPVDGAEVSGSSLASGFSGHTVVAILEPKTKKWWLVNSTDQSVLSRDWDIHSKTFTALHRLFAIGFCGASMEYPIHDGASLAQFYVSTLKKVPKSLLNQRVVGIRFEIGKSMLSDDGKLKNPRVKNLIAEQEELFKDYLLKPNRFAIVKLEAGEDNFETSCKKLGPGAWSASVGLKSSCSRSLLAFLLARVEHD